MPILLFLFALVLTFLAISRPPPQALLIGLPTHFPLGFRSDVPRELPILRIGVDPDGTATFNAVRVSSHQLAMLLDVAAHFKWTPGVIFEPHPRARYADALPVLGAISKAGLADLRFCFGGLASHRRFGKDWLVSQLRLTLVQPPAMPPPVDRSPAPGDCDPRSLALTPPID